MITITMPKFFAIAMIVWLVLDIIKILLVAVVSIAEAIADKKEQTLEKELEKLLRGIK